MAYPTNSLALVLSRIDQRMIAIRSQASREITRMAAGAVAASVFIDLAINFNDAKNELNTLATTPGLAQYAKDQKGDQTLDIVAEFQTVIAAIDGCVNWIVTNFPNSGGYLLRESWSGIGTVDRTFAPAETASLRTLLQVLANSIG